MIDSTHAQARAEKISAERLLSVTELATGKGFVARFSTDQGLRCSAQSLIKHGDGSFGIVIKPDGTIPREGEAHGIIWPNREPHMREGITVTAQMIYTCQATDSLATQTDHIENDLVGLVEDRAGDRAECCAVTVTYVASAAETYGNDEGRDLAERQAARLKSALVAIAYPDDEDDAGALLQNALRDLRHFADQNGLGFADADRTAHGIYMQEKGR